MSSAFDSILAEISKDTSVVPTSTTVVPPKTESIRDQLLDKVRKDVTTQHNETPKTGVEVYPEQSADVDAVDKLSFGFAQSMSGSSEAEIKPWAVNTYKYLKAEQPELAAKLGIREKGKYKDPTDSYVLNSVLAFAQAADTAIVSGLATLFGSEEQIEKWDKEVLERSFDKEWYDMSPDDRRNHIDAQAESQLRKDFPEFYANPELQESGWVTAGNMGASLISPETLIAPAATTYKAAAAIGAGWGAMDMALLDLADRGKIDPMHVAGGATFGAIFAPALRYSFIKGGKYTGEIIDKVAIKHRFNTSNKLLDKYEKMIATEVARGTSRGIARNTAQGALQLDNKTINHMYTVTGRERKLPKSAEAASDFLSTIDERLGWWKQNEAINRATAGLSKWTTPIIDRVASLSPKLAHELRGVDFRTHIRTHVYFESVKPWLKQYNKLGKADQIKIKKLLTVDSKEAFHKAGRIMYEASQRDPDVFKDFVGNWSQVRKVLREVSKEYQSKGYDFKPLEHFFPRTSKYPKHMTKAHVGLFHKLTSEAAEKKGGPLTPDELGILMRNTFSRVKKEGRKVKSSGHLRGRTVDEVTDFLEPYYADPVESIHSYLRMASNDIERQAFFQKFGLTQKEKINMDAIDAAIPKNIGKLAKTLQGLDANQLQQVEDMLSVRFTSGEASPHRFWQGFKNLGYIMTIFNPYSAMTQFGDQAFSLYKYGIRETAKAWITPTTLSKSDLGLTDAMEELFANTTMTKKTMDFFAKWSGFTTVDSFGKNTILNAALQKYVKQVKTKRGAKEIAQKWGRYFEEDTPKLLRDLHEGNLSDNVKLLLWHELSDVQPIALSEMPEKYLAMTDGRVWYMLKSFLIKQISFVRRQIVGELQQNNTTKGMTNLAMFAGYWNLVGGAVDAGKTELIDMFSGTDTPIDMSDLMVENTIQMIGLNKYHVSRAGQEGPIATLMDFFLPPVPMVDEIAIAAYQDRPEKAWRAVPWGGAIMDKVNKAQKKQQQRMGKFDITGDKGLSPREAKARRRLQQFHVE